MISMLNKFSGYNQVEVEEKDQQKMESTTPQGMFAYHRMPFRLINVSATFQRCMSKTFANLKDKIIFIYLDDLIVFSKKRKNHIKYLKKVLQRCQEHEISLNPKKYVLCVTEGKLLGHIVSQEGIRINPWQVEAIRRLSLPSNKTRVK